MELTFLDYLTMKTEDLVSHPQYSPHAHRVVQAISKMNTQQIEQIDLIGGKNRG